MTDRSTTDQPVPADEDTREHAAVASATAVAHPPDAAGTADVRAVDPRAGDHRADADDDADPVDGWDDDWDDAPREALPERPRRRLVTPATLALAGVVLVGAGFIGGVQVQKHAGDSGGGRGALAGGPGGGARGQGVAAGGPAGASTPAGGARAQAGGAAGTAGAPGASGDAAAGGATGGGAAGGATVGTVANVKGSRLYVTTADGTTVEVTVGSQATVSRLSKSSAGGVHPGDTIVVQGTAEDDGAVSATSVQAAASGLSLGGGGFGARAGAAGTGTGSGSSGRPSSGGSSGAVDQLFGGG